MAPVVILSKPLEFVVVVVVVVVVAAAVIDATLHISSTVKPVYAVRILFKKYLV